MKYAKKQDRNCMHHQWLPPCMDLPKRRILLLFISLVWMFHGHSKHSKVNRIHEGFLPIILL